MEIEYVTHASLFLRGAKVNLLTDPFFFPELDPLLAPSVRNFPPRPLRADQFGRLDYVFSSHEHHDHCHPETLARLAPFIGTVLLPAERPVLANRYRALGIENLVFLDNGVPKKLDGGLEVTCVWDGPVDTQLRVSLDGSVVLHGNDCRLGAPAVQALAARGPIDYAFLCSTSTQELFPLMLDKSFAELESLANVRENAFFETQVATLAMLKPKVVLPYSYTATYVEKELLAHNACGRLTPPLYRQRLAQRLPAQECWALEPGDVIDTGARSVKRFREHSLWGDDLTGFRAHLRDYAQSLEPTLPRFESGDATAVDASLRAHLERRLSEGIAHRGLFSWLDDAVAIHVDGTSGRRTHLADLARRDRPPTPGLEVSLPASLVKTMLDGTYDPFMILYTYKIHFALAAAVKSKLDPVKEYALELGVFLSLFADRTPALDAELAAMEAMLGPPRR